MGWNMSDVIRLGREKGLDLGDYWHDKIEMHREVERLCLPGMQTVVAFHSDEVPPSTFQGKSYFCRLIPPKQEMRRPYKERIDSTKELQEFYAGHEGHTIHLVEKGNVTHTGGIILPMETTGVIEIVRGSGEDLFHGKVTPMSAHLNWMGRPLFGEGWSKHEKALANESLRLIKRHPGYYEFEVWEEDDIRFRNYQPPSSKWCMI